MSRCSSARILRTAVDGLAHAVEDAAQHIARHAQLQGVAQEADLGVLQIQSGGGLEELDHGIVAADLQHLAATDGAVGQLDLAQLVIGDALDLPDHHQGAVDLLDRLVFTDHASAPPLATAASICSCMSRLICANTSGYLSSGMLLARPISSRKGILNRSAGWAPFSMAARQHAS